MEIRIGEKYWYTETASNGVKLTFKVEVVDKKNTSDGVGYQFKHLPSHSSSVSYGFTVYPEKFTKYCKDAHLKTN